MKKFLLAMVAVGAVATAQAQKSSLLIYGNLDYMMDKDAAKIQTNSFSINPGVGFQVTDNFTVGLQGGYGSVSSKDTAAGAKKYATTNMNIGIFARYGKPIGNIFVIYGQVDLGYQSGHDMYDGTEVKGTKHTGLAAGFWPAVGVNVCHGFALNFSFGGLTYSSDKLDVTGANTASNINLTFGHQVNVGISKNICFGHKMKGHHEPGDETRKIDTSDDEDAAPKKKPAKKDDDE